MGRPRPTINHGGTTATCTYVADTEPDLWLVREQDGFALTPQRVRLAMQRPTKVVSPTMAATPLAIPRRVQHSTLFPAHLKPVNVSSKLNPWCFAMAASIFDATAGAIMYTSDAGTCSAGGARALACNNPTRAEQQARVVVCVV